MTPADETPTLYDWAGGGAGPSAVEWGTRLALAKSAPDAEPPPRAPVPRWGWGEAPPTARESLPGGALRVALGGPGESLGTAERAEEVVAALMRQDPGGTRAVDRHAADGIDLQPPGRRLAASAGRVEKYRLSNVAQLSAPQGYETEVALLPCGYAGLVADQHLTAGGMTRHPGGEVHGRAEPVAVTLDCRSRVHADSDGWEAVTTSKVVDDTQAEAHGVTRTVESHHRSVTDLLDQLAPAGRNKVSDLPAEGLCEPRRALVAVGLRQSGKAGEVRKHEGVNHGRTSLTEPCPHD